MSTPDAPKPEPLLFDAADIDRVHEASWSLSALGRLVYWAGIGLRHAADDQRTQSARDHVGLSLEWLAAQIERQCAVIDEAV